MADFRRRCDIAHGGPFVAVASELDPRHRPDMGGLVVSLTVVGPTLDGIVSGDERRRLAEFGVRRAAGRQAVQHDPTQQIRDSTRCGVVPQDVESDLQHGLRNPVGQHA